MQNFDHSTTLRSLVIARRERVAFRLPLESSSPELMNVRETSLELSRTRPPESMASLSYSSLSLLSVSLLSALAVLSLCVLAFLSVGWAALKGLFCCKHERLTIALQLLSRPIRKSHGQDHRACHNGKGPWSLHRQ